MISPLMNKVQMMVGRAVLQAIDDSKGIQLLKLALLKDEVRSKVERFQNYGFTSHPKPDAEAIVIFPSGDRSHGICIVCDDRVYRLKNMAEGEVALYSDEGDYIWLKRGRKMFVNTVELQVDASTSVVVNSPTVTVNANTEVNINTPTLNVSDNVNVGGNVQVDGTIDADGVITSQVDVRTPAGGGDGIGLLEIQSDYNVHTHDYDDDGNTETTTGPNTQI